MTLNPYSVEENTLASEILSQMNKRKITSVCVIKKTTKRNNRCYSYTQSFESP